MPAATLAQTLGISAPLIEAQQPFTLYVGWQNLVTYVDKSSYKLHATNPRTPDTFEFEITDRLNVIGSTIHQQDLVIWRSTADEAALRPPLFQGFIKTIEPILTATYARWHITCTDYSDLLDYCVIPTMVRPSETAAARILAGLANSIPGIPLGMNAGATIVNTTVLAAQTYTKETVRSFIEHVLQAADATASYSVDATGALRVWSGVTGPAAPYDLSDTPNGTTTVGARIEPLYDGTADVDGVYVYGATPAGSGVVMGTNIPRTPARIAGVDAPYCTDAATRNSIGLSALAQRQLLLSVTATVFNWDGWAKNQLVHVTNAVLGWSAKPFVISGVEMSVRSGTGIREYTLTLGAPQLSLAGATAASGNVSAGATSGQGLTGQLGGPNSPPLDAGAAGAQVTSSGVQVVDSTGATRATLGLLPSGDYGLQIVGPAGTVTIIDGTSDVFKIAASGTLSATAPAASGGSQGQSSSSATLSALGTFSLPRAHLSFISAVGAWNIGDFVNGPSNVMTVAPAGGGSNWNVIPLTDQAFVGSQLNGSSQAVMALVVYTSVGPTAWSAQYYCLLEATS